ncbi:MAG: FxsA family protein [Alphaproteobacteria bacterium]
MTRLLLLAFILTPIIEIAGFIAVGGWIGLWPTLLVVLLTAVAGTILVRQQSAQVISRINSQLGAGEIPGRALFDGLCLFAAALLLLTPGFFTDSIGIALLLPPIRSFLAPRLLRWAQSRGSVSFGGMGAGMSGGFASYGFSSADQGPTAHGPIVIEGEAEVIEPDQGPDANRRDNGA